MTNIHSVDTGSPPTQDDAARDAIQTWPGAAYDMCLEDTGDGCAAIVRLIKGVPTELGTVGFNKKLNTHVITWNQLGREELSQRSRERWDDSFYYSMAQWCRL